MSDHGLALGALDLNAGVEHDDGFMLSVAADGFSFGAPEAVRVIIASLLGDGDRTKITRHGNRLVSFRVMVSAPDTVALSAGEKALALEVGKANTLTWTMPGGLDSVSVFEVVTSEMSNEFDDFDLLRPTKTLTYSVTLECAPFARSATEQTVTFAPGSGTIATLDDCTALTNWTPTTGTTLSTATWLGASAVKLDVTYFGDGATWTGALPATTYLFVDVAASNGRRPDVVMIVGGGAAVAVAEEPQASGFHRFFFETPASAPRFQIDAFGGFDASVDFYVDKVGSATAFPSTSLLIAQIEGSVRTPGSVVVAGGANLGHTMVYSDPTMMQYGWSPGDPDSWDNAPDGSYVAYLRVVGDSVTAGDVWGVQINRGVGVEQEVASRIDFSDAGPSRWFPVGVLDLGGKRSGRLGLAASDFDVTKGGFLYTTPGTASLRLFRVDPDASLVYVRSHERQRLVIDVPSLDMPQGGVWGANSADLSDAVTVEASADSWGFPLLAPPLTALWVASTGVASPTVTLTYYPRAHTFMDC